MDLTRRLVKQAIASALVVFSSITFSTHVRAALVLDIQPVQICLDNGTSCGAMNFDSGALGSFWLGQAGITLNILGSRSFNSSALHTMDTVSEARGFVLSDPSDDPLAPARSLVGPITVWFSNQGFGAGPQNMALVEGNRSWVASNLTVDLQTIFLAQAIGYNLGLETLRNPFHVNLMTSVFSANENLSNLSLFNEQISIAQRSGLIYERQVSLVPEPETYTMMLAGLLLIAALTRRNRSKPLGET